VRPEGVRVLAQAVMEAETTELTGAAKAERIPVHVPFPAADARTVITTSSDLSAPG
jgi:hypothetical protein